MPLELTYAQRCRLLPAALEALGAPPDKLTKPTIHLRTEDIITHAYVELFSQFPESVPWTIADAFILAEAVAARVNELEEGIAIFDLPSLAKACGSEKLATYAIQLNGARRHTTERGDVWSSMRNTPSSLDPVMSFEPSFFGDALRKRADAVDVAA